MHRLTFLEGLLAMFGLLAGCIRAFSAGVTGDGKAILATLTAVESLFSCELQGSMASLLGTGVIVTFRLALGMVLDFDVSVRHGKRVSFLDKVLDEDRGCWGDEFAPAGEV